jgi:apolipoprotein D and lipocalin family protein
MFLPSLSEAGEGMKLRTLGTVAALAALTAGAVAAAHAASEARAAATTLRPVPDLDLDRYMGRWYEIARYPNRFQRRCTGSVSADYARRDDGLIDVVNRCGTTNGGSDTVQGTARPDASPPPMRAKLQVRFAPTWLGWLPVVWGRYWVVLLDRDYGYAVVSEPAGKYLWILARDRHMDDATYASIVARIDALGLDTGKLARTVQP